MISKKFLSTDSVRKSRRPSNTWTAFLIVIWLGFLELPADAATYQLVDLGASVDAYGSYASGINEVGVVVGLDYPNGTVTPALFVAGQPPQFLTGSPAWGADAFSINRSGQVAGTDRNSDAVLFTDGRMVPVVRLPNTTSNAWGINDAGDVVGSFSSGGPSEAYVWRNGKLRTLGFLPGDDLALAIAINLKGQITGASANGRNGEFRAFLYQNGKMVVAAAMKGQDIFGNAINANGDIAGVSFDAPSRNSSRAFVRIGGSVRQFGPFKGDKHCAARGINSFGQVVGSSDRLDANGAHSASKSATAFIYSDGRLLDLNTLVVAPGWKITFAAGINDQGQIAATARNPAGVARAVRLDPIATVQFAGPTSRSTSSRILKLRGTAGAISGVARVEYRVGKKGHYRLASGTSQWRAAAKLKRGMNRLSLRSIAASGESSLPVGLNINVH